ncbi:aconitase X swivel domain-containing protein [Aminomonas paucivorans]|uniref:aconitase X swivel domain-containing protein n=1 Tax=Aminomonas paucivorans TaxID=81412 RepID=UPI00331E0F8D
MEYEEKRYRCRSIVKGSGEGEAIVSREAMCFYLCDPETGTVIEKNHPLQGRSIAGKVLVLQSGKGSSVVQVDGFYQLSVKKTLPAAIVVRETEPVLVSSAVVVGEPMVDRVEADPFEIIRDGDWVRVDGEAQEILVRRPRA